MQMSLYISGTLFVLFFHRIPAAPRLIKSHWDKFCPYMFVLDDTLIAESLTQCQLFMGCWFSRRCRIYSLP